jgi:hypothetical protein
VKALVFRYPFQYPCSYAWGRASVGRVDLDAVGHQVSDGMMGGRG